MKQILFLTFSLKDLPFAFLPSQDQHRFSFSGLFLLSYTPLVVTRAEILSPFLHLVFLLFFSHPSCLLLQFFSFFLTYLSLKILIAGHMTVARDHVFDSFP
jgi:hypothetical protein